MKAFLWKIVLNNFNNVKMLYKAPLQASVIIKCKLNRLNESSESLIVRNVKYISFGVDYELTFYVS